MIRVLVSACLLGDPVRYNGRGCKVEHQILAVWQAEGRVVSCCPELAGGLPVPRAPAEMQADGSVIDASGNDLTRAFRDGAARALELARERNVRAAILTDGSPSCGTSFVYDGSFTGRKRPGTGVTAALLEANGIVVFSQARIAEAACYIRALEALEASAVRYI